MLGLVLSHEITDNQEVDVVYSTEHNIIYFVLVEINNSCGVGDLIMTYNEYLMTGENLYFLSIFREALELKKMQKERVWYIKLPNSKIYHMRYR